MSRINNFFHKGEIMKSKKLYAILLAVFVAMTGTGSARAAMFDKVREGFQKGNKIGESMSEISGDEFDALLRRAESHLLAVLHEDDS